MTKAGLDRRTFFARTGTTLIGLGTLAGVGAAHGDESGESNGDDEGEGNIWLEAVNVEKEDAVGTPPQVDETATVSPLIINQTKSDHTVRTRVTIDGKEVGFTTDMVVHAGSDRWTGINFTPHSSGEHTVETALQIRVCGEWYTIETQTQTFTVEGDDSADGGGEVPPDEDTDEDTDESPDEGTDDGETGGGDTGSGDDESDDGTDSAGGERVVGYYPSYRRWEYPPSEVPLDKLTHLTYAFLEVGEDGEVRIPSGSAETHQQNLEEFQSLSGETDTKFILSVGGAVDSGNFPAAVSTAENRQRFAESAVALMREYDFDGINLDWEYPGERNGAEGRQNFTDLMRALRTALDEAGAQDGAEYTLSFAAGAGEWGRGHYQIDALAEPVDYVNVMTYDYAGPWMDQTTHNAPLDQVTEDIRAWADSAFDADDVVVGVPFYARGFNGVPAENNGYLQPYDSAFGTIGYDALLNGRLSNPAFETYWDDSASVPYAYNGDEWVTYSNSRSTELKGELGAQYGGVKIWELSHDTDDGVLLDAVRTGLGLSNSN